jgi:hypothetical protein
MFILVQGRKNDTNVFFEGLAEHFGHVPAFCIFCAETFGPSDKLAVVDLILPE